MMGCDSGAYELQMKPLRCPICHKPVDPTPDPSGSSVFPFCSDRCRLVDLGKWLSGKYQIPVESEEEENPDYPVRNGWGYPSDEDDRSD